MKITEKINHNGGGNQTPNRLVIHAMSEYIDGEHASDFLNNIGLSAHFLIAPDGEIIKTRSTLLKAWHAKGYNTNSIGIEILVPGENNYDEFVKKIKTNYCGKDQFNSLVEISKNIIEHWDIKNIDRHSDLSPERKVDPGEGFDWVRFLNELKE